MLRIHPIHLRFSNAFLIENNKDLFLIDTGMPGDEKYILEAIHSLIGRKLRLIFITHAHLDHFGGAAIIKAQTGAPVGIHREDANAFANGDTKLGHARGKGKIIKGLLPLFQALYPPQTTIADFLYDDGDLIGNFGINARIIHTPGHTPGSASLLLDEYLFVGDLLSSTGEPHYQRYYATNWEQIPQSLIKIEALHAKTIYPGHGRQTISGSELHQMIETIQMK